MPPEMDRISWENSQHQPSTGMAKVLLISQSTFIIQKMTSALEEAGYQLLCAPDCSQALERLGDIVPDLIIIEGNTFLAGAWEDYQKIRESFPSLLVLIGSQPEDKAWSRAVALGADLYLRKPVADLELLAWVRALLRRAKENRQ